MKDNLLRKPLFPNEAETKETLAEERRVLQEEVARLLAALAAMNSVVAHQTDRLGIGMGPNGLPLKVHPLTCGNDSGHTPLYPFWDGEKVVLVCRDCDYTQDNCAGHDGDGFTH